MRPLLLIKPITDLLPEIETPKREVTFREKVIWTMMTLILFLVLSQVPLYGIRVSSSTDPFNWLRVLTASNRETLMELGISPIVTSGMVLQLITGLNLIKFDQSNREDRMLFQGTQKLVGLLITAGQAVIYVKSGMYGDIKDLGTGNCMLIISQLFIAGVIVILLDELMQKGYGMGSGISLFIAANICETIAWKSLSPTKIVTIRGAEYEGAVTSFFHLMFKNENKLLALRESFYRRGLPNMLNLAATFAIFVIVIYFQGFRVELPIKNERVRSQESKYPIKLFYTSNIPIILQTALVSSLYSVSRLLYQHFPKNKLVQLFGVWMKTNESGYSVPTWGIAYYVSPPKSFYEIVTDPFHSIFYFTFVLGSSALFSRAWIDISGSSAKDVAKQLASENLVIKGHRGQSTVKVLNRYIPIAATFGGMCIGCLTVFADYLGAIGSGTGILLVVTIFFQYFEIYAKEQQKSGKTFLSLLKSMQ